MLYWLHIRITFDNFNPFPNRVCTDSIPFSTSDTIRSASASTHYPHPLWIRLKIWYGHYLSESDTFSPLALPMLFSFHVLMWIMCTINLISTTSLVMKCSVNVNVVVHLYCGWYACMLIRNMLVFCMGKHCWKA